MTRANTRFGPLKPEILIALVAAAAFVVVAGLSLIR